MDLRPLYPRATAAAVLVLPRVTCCGLARTLLLHGLGVHPASLAAVRNVLRGVALHQRCPACGAGPRYHRTAAPCSVPPPVSTAPAADGLYRERSAAQVCAGA